MMTDIYPVSNLSPDEAYAAKSYLEQRKMTVPTDLMQLVKSYTQSFPSINEKKQAAAFEKYNNSLDMVPGNTHRPIWPIYPIFSRIWNEYLKKHGFSQYAKDLKNLVEATSNSLSGMSLSGEFRPKLLLGYVQSGKTNAFELIMARCFDMGFEVCVLLTANNKKLLNQTCQRLEKDFKPINNDPYSQLPTISFVDIDNLENAITGVAANNRLVVIVNKEINNLNKLVACKDLYWYRVLVIDDEADIISRGFNNVNNNTQIASCSGIIEQLRNELRKGSYAYLQVTATCYNLILQPISTNKVIDNHSNTLSVTSFNPSEIFILEPYPGYKGVDTFFGNSNLYLKQLPSDKINIVDQLFEAIITYLVGAIILIELNQNSPNCCIIHTSIDKRKHSAICEGVNEILNLKNNSPQDWQKRLNVIWPKVCQDFKEAFNKLRKKDPNSNLNSLENSVKSKLEKLLSNPRKISLKILNSENATDNIIKAGTVSLTGLFNIFIGGYMLDRGVTFDHLITFIYARTPNQRDTVIQHARFFGHRTDDELMVTRLFMPSITSATMLQMHKLDKDLRQVIRNCQPGERLQIVRSKGENLCSRNKILLSDIVESSGLELLPRGMQIDSNTIQAGNAKVGNILAKYTNVSNCVIAHQDAEDMLRAIGHTYMSGIPNSQADGKMQIDNIIRFLTNQYPYQNISLHYYPGRQLSRKTQKGEWMTQVLSSHSGGDRDKARHAAKQTNAPVLVLTEQAGQRADGWSGHKFYWPVIVLPNTMQDLKWITIRN